MIKIKPIGAELTSAQARSYWLDNRKFQTEDGNLINKAKADELQESVEIVLSNNKTIVMRPSRERKT